LNKLDPLYKNINFHSLVAENNTAKEYIIKQSSFMDHPQMSTKRIYVAH
jgi:hypothetical protein